MIRGPGAPAAGGRTQREPRQPQGHCEPHRLPAQPPTRTLGVRVARKTLLAVAGLVSVHDHTWTTDRSRAAQRWSELEPGLAAELSRLHSWVSGERHPAREAAKRALADDGIIAAIVERFDSLIGLWADDPEAQ